MNEKSPHPPTQLNHGHFDQDSPLSLYAKMGEKWAKNFTDRLAEVPDCIELLADETVLKNHLEKVHKFCPNGADHRYRLQLWLEYENAVKLDRPMIMKNVYNLVGPESTFHSLVMKDARRVAWLLCKPVSYEVFSREILATGLNRLRAYLDKDAFAEGKKPDHKLAKLQFDITRMMDLRQHGAPTQKIHSVEFKGTIGANGELQAAVDKADMKALEMRRQDLEKRRRAAEGRGQSGVAAPPAPIIDVEVVMEGDEEDKVKRGKGEG